MLHSEKDIALFYRDHPYLIAEEFGTSPSYSEMVKGKNRLDLLIKRSAGKHTIVEFKRVPLQPEDIDQVVRYWKVWQKEYSLTGKHYLVGLKPRNFEAFTKTLMPTDFKLMIRYIPEDVPSVVRWDSQKQRYVRYQEDDRGECLELLIRR